MSLFFHLPGLAKSDLPEVFPSPFRGKPHPITHRACEELRDFLESPRAREMLGHDFQLPGGGKMFGILVVVNGQGEIGYLRGFSGMVGNRWNCPGFVPPIFDPDRRESFFPEGERTLAELTGKIQALQSSLKYAQLLQEKQTLERGMGEDLENLRALHQERKAERHRRRDGLIQSGESETEGGREILRRLDMESQLDQRERKERLRHWKGLLETNGGLRHTHESEVSRLKKERTDLSSSLLIRLFSDYNLSSGKGEGRPITDFFPNQLPPGGTGECAGPKLLQFANNHGYRPVAMAEFWWGHSPTDEIRHHGQTYPACRGKCGPILPHMLSPLRVEPNPAGERPDHRQVLSIVYEDNDLVIVDKPSGMLSVPGKGIRTSALIHLQRLYPEATGPILVHRLDMDTSGLLLAAKRSEIHKALQKQFLDRSVEKGYVALLSGDLPQSMGTVGEIDLPLRVDLDDRPRQMVCFTYGKPARTRWELLAREKDAKGDPVTRIAFYPQTGRTHQLRLHAAHPDGLGLPIQGDDLYGDGEGRLKLHARRLTFTHPVSGERLEIVSEPEF